MVRLKVLNEWEGLMLNRFVYHLRRNAAAVKMQHGDRNTLSLYV